MKIEIADNQQPQANQNFKKIDEDLAENPNYDDFKNLKMFVEEQMRVFRR